MPLIYITGISGTGKSTIASELKKRGYESYDADEDGFNAYHDRVTGELVNGNDEANTHTAEWNKKYEWKTLRKKVEELKTRSNKKTIFLSGVSGNHQEIWDLFDRTYCLIIDEGIMRHRVMNRTKKEYGKAPHELKSLVEWLPSYEPHYRALGSTIIDSTQPLDNVVDDILAAILSP